MNTAPRSQVTGEAFAATPTAWKSEFPKILCESCFGARVDGIFVAYRGADVLAESWESDLANILDEDVAASFAEDEDSPRCQSCRRNLHGEDLYVETAELSEHLSVLDDTSAVEVSRKRRAQVFRHYGKKCFACGSDGPLAIDTSIPDPAAALPPFTTSSPYARNADKQRLTACRSTLSPFVILGPATTDPRS